jgi:hypothetical protein
MAAANARDDRRSVFISHSARDARLASALSDLLHDALPQLSVSYSSQQEIGSGNRVGDRFFEWVRERVQASAYVFVLLTPESLRSPWLSFEAGIAASTDHPRIVPIVFQLEIAHVPAPFQQFQIVRGDSYENVRRLLEQLLSQEETSRDVGVYARLDPLVRDFIERVKEGLAERSPEPVVPARESGPRQTTSTINDEDARMLCELLFRIVVKLRERPEMLQSLEATAFWAAVRKIRPSAASLDDLRAMNADLASEPAPGPLWAAWMRHVRATELAAVVQNPGVARNPA